MRLDETRYGAATDRPALLIAHGLFGSGRNWGVIARRLADSRQVIAIDMRNHGGSGWSDSHGYGDLAGDLAETITAHGTPMDVLGHSMGGKAAMVLAVTHPALVRRLIVADIAPVAYAHSQAHLIDAMRRIGADHPDRASADAALADTVDDPSVRSFLLQSLDIGHQRWRLNLDALDREMPRIVGFPDLTASYLGPTLFLSGADSAYVQPQHRPAIRRLFPAARFAKIPGAGHWLHADRPREVEAAARVFLDA